jgi:hypothetical protein
VPDDGGVFARFTALAISPSYPRSAPFRTLMARRDVGPEDLDVQAPEAANRPEAVALALRRGHRPLPIRLDPELDRPDRVALLPGDEDDGLVRERVMAALEQGARLRGFEPADVDAVDRDLRLNCGSGEDEPQASAVACCDESSRRRGRASPASREIRLRRRALALSRICPASISAIAAGGTCRPALPTLCETSTPSNCPVARSPHTR